mmetsp:Transcript_7306/g.22610  ORF Transcript_7306/g.22610 Transcript_7306/m.22610 type:complete len:220 (-) Transcript_7306:219-878(-)
MPFPALLVDQPELLDTIQHVGDPVVNLLSPDPVRGCEDVQVIGVLNAGGNEVVEVDPQQLCHLPLHKPLLAEVRATYVERALQRVEVVGLHFSDLAEEVDQQREKPEGHLLVPNRRGVVGPWVPPTETEDEDTARCETCEPQPELLQEDRPDPVLLAAAPHAPVPLVPRNVVPQVLRVADADVYFGGDEVGRRYLKEISLLQEEAVAPHAHWEAPGGGW